MEELIKTLTYKSDVESPSLGVALTTYGATPYVHLQLLNKKKYYPEIPTIILDNNSPQKEMLATLCNQFNATFYSRNNPLPYPIVELQNLIETIKWGERRNLEYMVKLSVRLLPTNSWIDNLKTDIRTTGFKSLYSKSCDLTHVPIRLESYVLKVDDFVKVTPSIQKLLTNCLEGTFKRFDRFEKKIYELGLELKGVSDWNLLSHNRNETQDYLHRYKLNSWFEFYQLSQEEGLKYEPTHFKGV